MCTKQVLRIQSFCILILLVICVNGKFRKTATEVLYRLKEHNTEVDRYYENRKNWVTSNLGAILFKHKNPDIFSHNLEKNKTYLILTWKWKLSLAIRLVYNDGLMTEHAYNSTKFFDDCRLKNCILTYNDKDFKKADAVVIHAPQTGLPVVRHRNYNQRWIYFTEESPLETYLENPEIYPLSEDLANIFNWTMTYRSDSDVPVPYGRTIPLSEPVDVNMSNKKRALRRLVPYWDQKTEKKVMAVLNRCDPDKMKVISGLRKHIGVDIFGECSDIEENKLKCTGRGECTLSSKYYFYLVLETTKCRQFISENAFHHAYSQGAIPVLMEPPLEDCENLLPPRSFLHIDQSRNVDDLALRLADISETRIRMLNYHAWRQHFKVVNEHGFFKTKSRHMCRVCEALNFNDRSKKVYNEDDINMFINPKMLCDAAQMTTYDILH